jgi:hypothetical protein
MTPDLRLTPIIPLISLAPGFFLLWYGFLLWKDASPSLSLSKIALDFAIALLAGLVSWTATALAVFYWRFL